MRAFALTVCMVTVGLVQYAHATTIVDAVRSNPVADDAITIDGDMSDWAGVSAFPVDPTGDGGAAADWVKGWIANDSNYIYVRVDRATTSWGDSSWTLFDIDKNALTGYPLGGIGDDVNTAGSPDTYSRLNCWISETSGAGSYTVPRAASSDGLSFEYRLPRSFVTSTGTSVSFGNDFYVIWLDGNSGGGDRMPNGSGDGNVHVFEYQAGAVPEPSGLVLLTVGLTTLLAYAWRKRK
jgi:hypothetical protein